MLSPINGRPLGAAWEAAHKSGIRKCYQGRHDEIKTPVLSMYRLPPGPLFEVGNQVHARIQITRTKLLLNLNFLGRENARLVERQQRTLATILQELALLLEQASQQAKN